MTEVTRKLRVLVAEEQTLMRSGIITAILECGTKVEIIEASSYSESVILIRDGSFDVIVCDINMHVENVLLVHYFRQLSQSISILVYSGYDERIYALPSIQAGADGYLSKQSSKEQFKTAWMTIISKKKYLSPVVQELVFQKVEDGHMGEKSMLSAKEFEILQLLKRYNSTKQISELLGLKPNTISIYKKRIFEKLGIPDELTFYKKMLRQ